MQREDWKGPSSRRHRAPEQLPLCNTNSNQSSKSIKGNKDIFCSKDNQI